MADQDGSDASPTESQVSDSQCRSDEGGASWSSRPTSSGSGQAYTPTLTPTLTPTPTNTTAATSTSPSSGTPIKADSLYSKIDERQRLARERREEKEKHNAVKEAQMQEREERARQHYERHLEERRKKLEEQRVKEEKRRAAVEEKRRQKQEEDRVRHETVMRRTLERSQRARQKPNRWSWGGALHSNTPSTPADADRRSVSTMNLSKQADPVITKRLSSSSATLLHSPDRGLRRHPLTPWENTMVNRLQQPTHSYLARSRSAMSLSGEQAVSCHPMGSMSFKALQAQPLTHCRSQERSLSRDTGSSSSAPRRRTTGAPQHKERDFARKSWSNLSLPLAPTFTMPPKKRSTSPGKKKGKMTVPSPGRPPQKPTGRPPTPKQLKPPGPDDPGNLRPARVTPESHSPSPAEEGEGAICPPQPRPQPLGQTKASTEPTPAGSAGESAGSPPAHKPSAGTMDPEEASRILAEKRRQAREQREREEEERRQQEEQMRLAKEEMARRKAEERAKRKEDARQLAEEKRRKEEEEQQEEEERIQREREEAERLQKQREEEESRQREEAERMRQEREKHFQKEEAERLERKRRLEEIMKRTRRSDPAEKKATPQRNGDETVSHSSPGPSAVSVPEIEHSNGDGDQTSSPYSDASFTTLTPADQRENGEFEEVITLPPEPSVLSPPAEEEEDEEKQEAEDRVPVIAFRENGLLKPLSGVDELPTQQRADVI